MTEFWTSKTVTAAKPHRCDECRTPIASGDRHGYEAGKQEGMFYSYRLCARCQAMWAKAWATFGWMSDEAPIVGELRDDIRAEGIDDPEAWLDEPSANEAAPSEDDAHKTNNNNAVPAMLEGGER